MIQSSYLSQISQIIFVEKNLSCGEISDFCKEFEQFMEFYRNLCRFFLNLCGEKSVWRKNDKYEVCMSSLCLWQRFISQRTVQVFTIEMPFESLTTSAIRSLQTFCCPGLNQMRGNKTKRQKQNPKTWNHLVMKCRITNK